MVNEKNAGIFLIVAIFIISFLITSNVIGAVNFILNDKRSRLSYVNLSDKISWLIPKYGGYHHSHGIYPYRIYKYTFIMGIIHDLLPIFVTVIAILLTYLTDLHALQIAYLGVIPAIYLIIVIISGLIVIKKCKPDPNPFH